MARKWGDVGFTREAGRQKSSHGHVIIYDYGWDRFIKEMHIISNMSGPGVKVGVLSNVKHRDDPKEDMLDIAISNEFGNADNNQPPRPFIRGAFDMYRQDLDKFRERLLTQVMKGKITLNKALGLLGKKHQGQIQKYMTDLMHPHNAPLTIMLKGTDNPLIDTGQLRRSIDFKVVMK